MGGTVPSPDSLRPASRCGSERPALAVHGAGSVVRVPRIGPGQMLRRPLTSARPQPPPAPSTAASRTVPSTAASRTVPSRPQTGYHMGQTLGPAGEEGFTQDGAEMMMMMIGILGRVDFGWGGDDGSVGRPCNVGRRSGLLRGGSRQPRDGVLHGSRWMLECRGNSEFLT